MLTETKPEEMKKNQNETKEFRKTKQNEKERKYPEMQ